MIEFFYNTLHIPIYNLLIGLTDILPGYDIGLAVVAVTLIVKVLIMPLSFAALRTQRSVRAMEPEMKKIREDMKEDKEAQAKAMFALYKEHKVNPFAGLLTLIIQLPIVLSLYWVFNSKTLLTVNTEILYSFIPVPETIAPLFLGVFAITGASIILSILAGLTQLAYGWYAIPMPEKPKEPGKNMQADFGRAMATQMRFMLPIFIAVAAYFTSVAIALYFITSNLVGVLQEWIVRREKSKA